MRNLRTLLCQINTTPGDFDGNVEAIKKGMLEGFKHKADLIVFPELSIPGYLMRDMVFDSGFVEENLRRLEEIKSFYDVAVGVNSNQYHPTVVVGYVDHNHCGWGKPFRNMAAVIRDGVIIGTYAKQLLPFYDVFDEGRYFQPGTELCVIEVCGDKWGICICEDVWNDKGSDDYSYSNNPIQKYRDLGVDNIISINSSPFAQGKPKRRMRMLQRSTQVGNHQGRMIYVNQTGAQDELVFDGHSMIVENGRVSFFAEGSDQYRLYDEKEHARTYNSAEWRNDDYFSDRAQQHLYEALITGLRDYITKTGHKEVVVGSSGGIDSAVVLALACEAIGPENVHGIRMPSIFNSQSSSDDALALHTNLGCHDYAVPVEHQPVIDQIRKNLIATDRTQWLVDDTDCDADLSKVDSTLLAASCPKPFNPVANENIQARIRGNIIMWFSNAYGVLPLTTGNKTELALGYCTLYGDMNGGFAPINGLYKLDVYDVARYINERNPVIPENILNKAASAELAPGQTDEASLLPYAILDPIVRACIEGQITNFRKFFDSATDWGTSIDSRRAVSNWVNTGPAEKEYNRMIKLIKINEFKRRQAAPGIKVSKIDFGTGRRYPIVKR
jgi:NAD+ synthase (glutamine-hydrolysing)